MPDSHPLDSLSPEATAAMIHPSAQIDRSAKIAVDVRIGAFSVIGANVEIGAGTEIGPHVVIEGPTRIGSNNRIWQFTSIGAAAQDKKFAGERSELIIGDGNVFREFCTIHRGTGEGGITRIGNDNWIMAYVHIAHDCIVGNHTIFSNNATLAGHVEVADWVILSGFCGVHQFCKIGAHAFAAMYSAINRDVPPYVLVAGQFAEPRGINNEGLKRRGFSAERILAIKRAYKILYKSGLPLNEAREKLSLAAVGAPDIQALVDFLGLSQRSIVR